MNKLDKAKEIVKKYAKDYLYGIFNTRNIFGDPMEVLYEDEELRIEGCYDFSYLEVFGLSDTELKKLEKYYVSL